MKQLCRNSASKGAVPQHILCKCERGSVKRAKLQVVVHFLGGVSELSQLRRPRYETSHHVISLIFFKLTMSVQQLVQLRHVQLRIRHLFSVCVLLEIRRICERTWVSWRVVCFCTSGLTKRRRQSAILHEQRQRTFTCRCVGLSAHARANAASCGQVRDPLNFESESEIRNR